MPCYLAILKGTSCWTDDGLKEYSSLDVMQMLGRAGRPQFETSACAIILTHSKKVRRYEEMVSGQEALESYLHENLIEHLNAEIGVGTVRDLSSANTWLASSFLSVRLRRNPDYYRLAGHQTVYDPDQLLQEISERDLQLLQDAQLVQYHDSLRCTEYGDAMARYYVKYETMVDFLKLPRSPNLSEILTVMAQAHEFCDMKVRSGEKGTYKQINQANDIRYPIKVDIALPVHKVSLIVQAQLGGVNLDKSSLKYMAQFKQDTLSTMNQCNRLIRCIVDIGIHRQDAVAVRNSLELCRSLAAVAWDHTPMQLKQIESIGDVTARELACANISSISALTMAEPHQIEVALGKAQPYGSTLLKKAASCPNLRVSIKEIGRTMKGRSGTVELKLKCEIRYLNDSLPLFFKRKAVYICFLCETSTGKLIDFRRFSARCLQNGEEILLTASLDQQCKSISCHIMCDEIAGTSRSAELQLDIPHEWFSSKNVHSEQLDVLKQCSPVESRQTENFDDAQIADDEFLIAESLLDNIDMVSEDIGKATYNDREDPRFNRGVKRKAEVSLTAVSDSTPSTTYRQPKQLANGNWTCQHTCNEEKKQCKHQCCKEGVKKPKKRAKTDMNDTSSNKKALAGHQHCVDDPKPNKIYDIDEILRKTSTQSLPKQNNEFDGPWEGSCADTAQVAEQLEVAINPQSKIAETDKMWPSDLPSVGEIVSNNKNKQPRTSNIESIKNDLTDYEELYDIDDINLDYTECDWSHTETSQALDCDKTCTDPDPNLKDSQVTEDWSRDTATPSKFAVANGPFMSNTENDVPKYSGWLEPSPSSSLCSESTIAVLDERLDEFQDTDENVLARFGSGSSSTLLSNAKKQEPSQDLVSANVASCQSGTRSQSLYEEPYNKKHLEKISEEDKQLDWHKESQKEKWAKLPSWMYEEFGAYVDII